ncbi:MAG: hypothetical protein ACJAVA_000278 [Flavobacteriaceae bacterium]|jgi:hypothetical protein
MSTEENNKLIDSYMESKGEYISHKDGWGSEVWSSYEPNKYHSNWNLLMEAIKKINSYANEELSFSKFDDFRNNWAMIDRPSKYYIKDVHKQVVEFIEWYNETLTTS